MYRVHRFPVLPAIIAKPIKMPVDILLALPPYIKKPTKFFNLWGMIDSGLGELGWEKALEVFKPYLWAPGLDRKYILEYLNDASRPECKGQHIRFTGRHIRGSLLPSFPMSTGLRRYGDLIDPDRAQFEIIHFHGRITDAGVLLDDTGTTKTGAVLQAVSPERLIDALTAAETRLLILQVDPQDSADSNKFGRAVVRLGGPAVLTATSTSPDILSEFFVGLYGNILFNRPLSELGAVQTDNPNLHVNLFCGRSSEDLLQFNRVIQKLEEQVTQRVLTLGNRIDKHIATRNGMLNARPALHRSQDRDLVRRFNAVERRLPDALSQQVRMASKGSDVQLGIIDFRTPGTGSKVTGPRRTGESDRELRSTTYKVKRDDTLSSIAQKFQTSAGALAAANRIDHPNAIQSGQRLTIPSTPGPQIRGLIDQREHFMPPTPGRSWLKRPDNVVHRVQMMRSEVHNLDASLEAFTRAPHPSEIEKAKQEAPRVLNANFAHPKSKGGRMLRKREALTADEQYQLLVDVGPRWDKKGVSIVEGNIVFPIQALDPSKKGYVVQVVFISEDFQPNLVSADMWVPAKSGRSYPFTGGKQAKNPGPVALRLTPKFREESQTTTIKAHGRLCLYYQNNLLQSAIVTVGVALRPNVTLPWKNQIMVDFRLTGGFQDVERQFGKRKVKIGVDGVAVARPVNVNLTLNDDGSGRHRILAKSRLETEEKIDLPPAWKPYDPKAAEEVITEFHQALLECYQPFDPRDYKNEQEKFIADLTALAVVGNKFRNIAFSELRVDGMDPLDWEANLFDKALSEAAVIQVARTGPATYIFPWALVYSYPLEENMAERYRSCRTLREEWDEHAVRTKEPDLSCPYHESHTENVICPYGFWGYEHIIEQPLSTYDDLASASDAILTGDEYVLSIGYTNDLEKIQRDKHIEQLKKVMPARLDPETPADDRDKARLMLRAPKLVYFLCHGEKEGGQTYLSIGMHDNDASHQITANTLGNWRRHGIDRNAWKRTRPLIFINGCETADIRPGLALDLVSAFASLRASGVIGTEVSVQTSTAYSAAESVFKSLADGDEIGQAIRDMRWGLLKQGNVLGLAYTAYSLANLHIVKKRE
jgi:LysM repeat protein